MYPTLTAVCQDAFQIGFEAYTALTELIQPGANNAGSVRKALPTWLEVHDTTGPAPQRSVRVLPDGTKTEPVSQDL